MFGRPSVKLGVWNGPNPTDGILNWRPFQMWMTKLIMSTKPLAMPFHMPRRCGR